jgi:hypothetical protein
MRLLIFCLAFLTSFVGYSQSSFPIEEIQYSPGGKFEKVFDQNGNEFLLKDMKINTDPTSSNKVASFNDCNSGYFKLYYEDGSGFENGDNLTATGQLHAQRRAVLCQLFYDMSQFIIPVDPNTPVNIFVRKFNNSDLSNPPPVGALAYASSVFLLAPITNTSLGGGIADNAIWQTINSGIDPFTDFYSPINATQGAAGFYHGMIAFNFNNSWLTDLPTSQFPTDISNLYDLYSVGLHELIHAMGFASAINEFGQSKFGTNYPYYSRYDKFLQTTSGTNLLTNTSVCGTMYGYGFNPSLNLSILTSDGSNCNTIDLIKFGGSVNQNVYTNSTFEPASSLSHLEDQCHIPNTQLDNQYYVMSDANGTGWTYIKRFLKDEERQVLCDLGYNVNFVYGNSTNLTYKEYGSSVCGGNQIVGINDGITISASGNNYTYILDANINIPLDISTFLDNDYNPNGTTLTYECAESVYGYGAVYNIDASTISYAPNNTGSGLDLIRYIPIVNGQRGNITYIYIYVFSGNCIPTANCNNYVSNGDFENSNGCIFNTMATCWKPFIQSPDLFTTNPIIPGQNDCLFSALTIPTTWSSSPPTNTWDESPTNNFFIGLGGFGTGVEGVQNKLSSALLPNTNYTLRFRSKIGNNSSFSTADLVFALSEIPSISSSSSLSSTPTFLSPLPIQQVNSFDWEQYETTFSFSGSNPMNYLTIINASYINAFSTYLFIDDIEISQVNNSITFIPPSIPVYCSDQTINLLDYVNLPGGDFYGEGVSGTTFNASVAGIGIHELTYKYTSNNNCVTTITVPFIVVDPNQAPNISSECTGTSVILTGEDGFSDFVWSTGQTTQSITVMPSITTVYSLTATNACGITLNTTIAINPNFFSTPIPFINSSTSSPCAGSTLSVVFNGSQNFNGFQYLWSNGATTSTTFVEPNLTTGYSVTVSNVNGCQGHAMENIYVHSVGINGGNAICFGSSTVLQSAPAYGGGTSYLWSTGATTSFINISPTTTTTYSLTVTNPNGCVATASKTVVVYQPPIVSISGTSSICAGNFATLTASGGGYYSWSTGETTASITISPTSTTQYTLTVTNGFNCSAIETRTIDVDPLIIPAFNQISPICIGGTLNPLPTTSTNGIIGTWSPEPNNLETTTYSFTPSNGQCVIATSMTIIVLSSPATPTFAQISPICLGATNNSLPTLSLNGFTGTWSPLFNNTATNTYTFTPATGQCATIATMTVNVNVLPVAFISAEGPTTFCQGGSVVLNTQQDETYTYQWQINGTNINGASLNSYTALTAGSYDVVVTNNYNCLATSNVISVTIATPTALITASGSTTFCEGGSVILTTPLDASYTYQWQLDGNSISGATSNSYTAITSGSYTVVITNNNCSSTSNSISVTVNPSPTVNNITSQTVCAGQQTTPITFSGTATSYNWSNSNTTIGLGAINSVDISSFTATNSSSLPIISTITVTPLSGSCSGTPITFTITVNPRPSFSSATVVENSGLLNNDGTICLGASATISTTAQDPIWNTNPPQQAQTITVSPTASTIYTFITTNQYGCSFSNFISITVNDLPAVPTISVTESSGLTPNDGIICSGSGVTLNASGSLSPVWSTGNSGNVILVSPTSTTTYSATVTNSYGCTSTSNQVITVISPTVNSIANRNLCVNTNSTLINLNGGFPGTDYSWSNSNTAIGLGASGNGSIPSFVGLNGTPFPITGTITVIPTLDGCTGSPMSFNIIVNPLPNISISPNTVSITPGNSIQLTVTGATTYSWSPANGLSCTTCPNPVATPTTTTTYIAEGFINLTGCSSSASVQVVVEPVVSCNCTNNILSGNLSTNPTAKLSYCIDNNLNITGNNVTFTTSEFKIASNVTITVKPGAKLTILGCHLYSCGNMWNGIVVEPGGQLVVDDGLFFASSGWIIISHTFNSLIEDAKTAIQIQDNSPLTANILKVKNVVFNRNGCGIRIGTYTQNLATYPFSIENSIFTCRNIPFQTVFTPSNSSTWTQIAAIRGTSPTNNTNLGNVYISNSNYSQTDAAAYLKAPFPNQKSDVGIELVNVGLTLNASSTTPIYREFKMGSTLNMTIFDNLVYGINLINSNFTTVNSVFQNTATKSGVGIFATASDFKNYRLQVLPVLATVGNNKFVDCNKAIITNNYFENNIQYSDVRSTQSIPVTNPTKYGFYLTSNRYKNYNISYNSFYNVYTAVAIATLNNFYNVTGTLTNGQYAGKINVDFNTIRPNLSGVTVTQQYVENAITLENTGMLTESANGVISVISTNGNTIFANKGIVANNWKKQNIQIQNNNITITNNQNISSLFGIKVANCSSPNNFIRNNTVTGFYNPVANSPTSSDPDLTGIVTSLSPGFSVTCNTTSNTVRGIGFNGGNPNTTFKNNTMKNHRYGFFLDNNGVIDQQGTLNLPADNQWLGTWLSGNFKTALLTGSSAQNSPMYVRNIANYNPNGSSTAPFSGLSSDLYGINAFPPPPNNQLSNLRYSNSIYYPTNCLGVLFFPSLISSFENVALDAIIYSNDISGLGEKMRFINKDILYKTISQDSLLKDSSQVLLDFYNSNYSTSFEKINSIQKKLSSGKFNLASIENIALIAQNNIEDNYKKYHEIYIKYYQQSALSKQDSTSLKVLSEKCPFSDGAAIYQARSLYNLIFKTFDSFLDNCQIQEPTKMMQNESDNNLDSKNLIVYPNPAKDEIFIRCNNQEMAYMVIEILDANGKLVYSNPTLTFSGNLASFTLDVEQGIYFIQLTNPATNEKNIEKLIIQK